MSRIALPAPALAPPRCPSFRSSRANSARRGPRPAPDGGRGEAMGSRPQHRLTRRLRKRNHGPRSPGRGTSTKRCPLPPATSWRPGPSSPHRAVALTPVVATRRRPVYVFGAEVGRAPDAATAKLAKRVYECRSAYLVTSHHRRRLLAGRAPRADTDHVVLLLGAPDVRHFGS